MMQINLPTPQQLGGLGRDAMKIAGTLLVAAGGLSLLPAADVTSLLVDLQHLKNAGVELSAAFLGPGGILAISGIVWSLLKNTAKGLVTSASQVPGTTIVTTPAIAAETPPNVVSNTTNVVVSATAGHLSGAG